MNSVKKRLYFRHIAWLYALRIQLLKPAPWEHIDQQGHIGRAARFYQNNYGIGLVEADLSHTALGHFLSEEELKAVEAAPNPATKLMQNQSRDLAQIRETGLIEDFRHMELAQIIYHLIEHQGKAERIKKFPIPRQYAYMSRVFVGIFLLLIPFSIIPELMKLGPVGFWVSIPITALVGWVYLVMELLGDYSEFPFQGMANDIPMLSICRTIEIELKEMLGETDLPDPIQPVNDVLM